MGDVAKNLLKIIIGIILVVGPILGAITFKSWGLATLKFLQGGVAILVVLIGLIFLFIGFSDIKS